jgi:hypothetical protein
MQFRYLPNKKVAALEKFLAVAVFYYYGASFEWGHMNAPRHNSP